MAHTPCRHRFMIPVALAWLVLLPITALAQEDVPATTTAEEQPAATQPAMRIFTDALTEEQTVVIGDLQAAGEDEAPRFLFQAELSTRGAAVKTLKLADHFATVADKQRYFDDPATYPEAMAENPGKYKGHYSLLNPVGVGDGPKHLSMATAAVSIAADGGQPMAVPLDRVQWRPLPVERTEDAQTARFQLNVYGGASMAEARPLVRFVKTYRIVRNDYSIGMSLTMENLSDSELSVTVDQAGPTGLPREDVRTDMRQVAYANQLAEDKVQPRLKPAAQVADLPVDKREWLGSSDGKDPVLWVGDINKYFGSMLYLRPSQQAGNWLAAPTWRAMFFATPVRETPESVVALTGLQVPDIPLQAGQSKTLEFDIFAGPKKREVFSDAASPYHRDLYSKLNYIGVIDFGGCICAFSWLTLGMMWLLGVLSQVALGNYGVAIILLVLLVRLVMHPLTKKSQVSMMGMQKLGPKVQALKEKYADNKDALNREMAALYKEQGPAQLLGCLPMLLQMPIWIALWRGLDASVELRHAAFLPVWITDLAAPDALFTFPTSLPLIGDSFNLLPLLLCVAMYLQTKFSPQAAASAATSDQAAQQQKMMKIMMPVMMLVIFYKAASGLTLYIMASTFAGLIDQHYVRKHIQKTEAEEAAMQTTVRVPGKAPRSNRPKKPKGPFWMKKG